ncbi:putative F-box domain, FBD domain, F-box-like domain superfamily protein [Helianthus annuus]|nr:putative F-box domain, FBD domain, F-box-like domain superfamily protein [Helianthus annuus]KAJ0646547.1 putative F-box domain, FBD domain, F-box-like domain superfamily protein [Helianthus annuus]
MQQHYYNMEHHPPTRTRKLKSDFISTLPQNIIEDILTRIPLQEALRTSVLSKKWRYTWRGMPKLVFTDKMVNHLRIQLNKYKLISAIFHVLLFHNGPTIVEFRCSVGELHMESEFAQILSYLAGGNTVKEFIFISDKRSFKLPVSFFALQGLEHVHLENCTLEPPLTFNGVSSLTVMNFQNVEVSAQLLQRFISKCPLLQSFILIEVGKGIESVPAGGNNFTLVDLFQCVPLLVGFGITKHYMKYLCAGGMPHRLPASLVHLSYLFLHVCLVEQNEISSALCIIRSSPVLGKIVFLMDNNDKLPVQQTPADFLDPDGYPDLNLDHLEMLEIYNYSNLPLEMEFVKLIMAKSPVLKKVRIRLNSNVSADEERKMLKDMLLLSFPRASPSAKLIIVSP